MFGSNTSSSWRYMKDRFFFRFFFCHLEEKRCVVCLCLSCAQDRAGLVGMAICDVAACSVYFFIFFCSSELTDLALTGET